MNLTDLKSRTHKILEAIISAYVESAVPVGSEALWAKHRFKISPATIRNIMAELEGQGLVTHPHTSAGRVPTDLGYRYYADLLMEPRHLAPEEEAQIEAALRSLSEDPMGLLEGAARLLSDMAREAGVVLIPQMTQGSFRHLELIPMEPQEVVGVLIATEGLVRHAHLELEEPVEEEELLRLAHFLNQELSGMPLSEVNLYLERALLEATSGFFHLYKRALGLLSMSSFFEEDPTLILEGTSWIFEAPEFRDIHETRRLLKGLEQKELLTEILKKDLSADGVKFHIGSENRDLSLSRCTIASAPFRLRGGARGVLGVIGPTRMDYPRVSALVRKVAQVANRLQDQGV